MASQNVEQDSLGTNESNPSAVEELEKTAENQPQTLKAEIPSDAELAAMLTELETVIRRYFPALEESFKAALAVAVSMSFVDRDLPISLIF